MGSAARETYANVEPFRERCTAPSGRALLPGGYGAGRPSRSDPHADGRTGSGCHIQDEARRRLIDVHNNFTPLVHRSAHLTVVDSVCPAMRDGVAFGLPNMLEVGHAQMMVNRLRFVDQIRYTNSGTEAVMLAVRVARAATGRGMVVFVRKAYRDHSDSALVTGGDHTRVGVPDGVVKTPSRSVPTMLMHWPRCSTATTGRSQP